MNRPKRLCAFRKDGNLGIIVIALAVVTGAVLDAVLIACLVSVFLKGL